MSGDYYEVLQIAPSATFEEVHKAYRSLAMLYHPDRNSTPDAASTMIAINEAYAVLSEPARRREYDRQLAKREHFDISGPILRAAHETLLKQGWALSQSTGTTVVLEHGARSVRITFVARLDNERMKKISRQFAGFSVVVAVELETPLNLSFTTAVIDLMHSQHHGAAFPDDVYRALFAPFLGL